MPGVKSAGCSNATGWCGRIRPGESWRKGQCQKCWRVEHDAAVRRAYGVAGPPTPIRDPADPPGRVLSIPAPPPLDLRPTKPRAVVTVAAGPEGERLHAASGRHLARYAAKIGADFVVLRWRGLAEWGVSCKFQIARVLDHYERIAYLDGDTLPTPEAVDLFALCPPDRMGACDELPFHRRSGHDGVEAAYHRNREQNGFPDIRGSLPWYFNAGVMVVPRSHQSVIDPPATLWVPDGGVGRHCGEQDLFNARLLASGLPYHPMDRRANWQNWTDPGLRLAPPDAIRHWSAAGPDRVRRADLIRAAAAATPWSAGAPVVAPDPEWSIDERHVRWVRETLASGRFRRVLEIGSHRGYASAALLEAARDGQVDEVHLCEPAAGPELARVVAHYDLGARVTVHRCDSTALFARGWGGWDLVLADGDHRAEAADTEAAAMLAAGVRAVFAHDTAAAEAGRPACDGPPRLARAFRRAGYLSAEDRQLRTGERTERGMFFAARSADDFWSGRAAYQATCREPASGPGTELKSLLTSLGLDATGGCGCADRARQMDRGGVAWCRAHRGEIEGWLRAAAKKRGWVEKARAAVKAAATGLAARLGPFDPVPGLLDEAIRRAEVKAGAFPEVTNSPGA